MADTFHILIVDDNIGLARTMSFIFTRKGYSVDTAADGMAAVSMVKAKPYDLIFLDSKMLRSMVWRHSKG